MTSKRLDTDDLNGDIAVATARVVLLAVEMKVAMLAMNRLWRKGGLTVQQRREMRRAGRAARKAAGAER